MERWWRAVRNGQCRLSAVLSGILFLVAPNPVAAAIEIEQVSDLPLPCCANEIDVEDGFAYIAAGNSGLLIADVRDPAAPKPVLAYNPFAVRAVTVAGNRAYITRVAGFSILDISDPAHPALLGTVPLKSGFSSCSGSQIRIDGTRAYIVGSCGLHAVDISDEQNPEVIGFGTFSFSLIRPSLAVFDHHVYIQYGGDLFVIDFTDPEAPAGVGPFPGVCAEDCEVEAGDDRLYITGGGLSTPFQVLDISDRDAPVSLGDIDQDGSLLTSVEVRGNLAYVSDQGKILNSVRRGVLALDVSAHGDPVEIGYFDTDASVDWLDVDGSIVYAANNNSLRVLSVRNTCTSAADATCRDAYACEVGFCNAATQLCECPVGASPVSYAALGDSYSSGEGVSPFLSGTSGAFGNDCHRSTFAYARELRLPGRNGRSIGELAEEPGSGYALSFVACSGAITTAITDEYEGEVAQDSVLTEPDAFDMLTITIGGNDASFATVLTKCIDQLDCREGVLAPDHDPRPLRESVPATIEAMGPVLAELFSGLRAAAGSAPLFVAGYPLLVAGGEPCGDLGVFRHGNSISADEQLALRTWGVQLNATIREAAESAGVHFVDVAQRFADHEVCDAEPWIYGIHEVNHKLGGGRSFHPTRRGQRAYAEALEAFIRDKKRGGWEPGFTKAGLPRNPQPSGALLAAPRAVTATIVSTGLELTPVDRAGCGEFSHFAPGDLVGITASGFAPDAEVHVVVRSGGGAVVVAESTVTADAEGGLDDSIALPEDLAFPEILEISAEGDAPGGAVLVASVLVEVQAAASNDSDGDGIPDACDLCPQTESEQNDQDSDGLGDACDPCPDDSENDTDGDSLCAGADPCPLDPANDTDGDGACDSLDSCLQVADPEQLDLDENSVGDSCGQICSRPLTYAQAGATPKSSDCLHILRAAVGQHACVPDCICSPTGGLTPKSSDALRCLKRAVGQDVPLDCRC